MRRRFVSALALAAGITVLAGACGPDRVVTRPEPEPVTAERLAAALVTAEDLGGGYQPVEGEGTPMAAEVLPEHGCDDVLGDLAPELAASRDFAGPGGRVSHAVAWFPGQGGAVEQVYRALFDACRSVVATDASVSIRTAALDFGRLSRHTLPIAVELEPEGGTIEERDLIVIRRGDLVSVVRFTGPRPSDKGLLDRAVRVAIGHLGRLHHDTT